MYIGYSSTQVDRRLENSGITTLLKLWGPRTPSRPADQSILSSSPSRSPRASVKRNDVRIPDPRRRSVGGVLTLFQPVASIHPDGMMTLASSQPAWFPGNDYSTVYQTTHTYNMTEMWRYTYNAAKFFFQLPTLPGATAASRSLLTSPEMPPLPRLPRSHTFS